MNIIEVAKKENVGKKYETYNRVWTLKEETKGIFELYDENEDGITDLCYVSEIVNMEFEEVIDWSKIPVDTKMLVSKDNEIWHKRYFAEYKDGKVYCFSFGASSFSVDRDSYISAWEYVKLYEE